jgi:hypothetical protein
MTLDTAVIACIVFGKTCVGLVTKPYETYRRIVNHGKLYELVPLGIFFFGYLFIASLVKTAAFRPYLLTKQFIVLGAAAGFTYIVVVGLLWGISKFVQGQGTIKQLFLGWGYTLVPTIGWFLMTSLLYVLLPPPRTTRPLGFLFSAVYLVISSAFFFWKLMLSYLTLRFGMRLDLKRIIIVVLCVAPCLIFYSIGMYRLGIFRIPFI